MFIEQVAQRGISNKLWLDDAVPGRGAVASTTGSFHYEGALDSGVFNTDRDFTLVEVDIQQIDGWEITNNSFFFRIQTEPRQGQQPDIGSFGFGGRQGEHWMYQRATNFGYAHRPTESVQPLATLVYDPLNVTITQIQKTIGPLSITITTGAIIEWADVLQFSNGGRGRIVWTIGAKGVVEKIYIDQLGRDYITANPQNAAWTDADTYLGFMVDIDYTNIPRRLMRGVDIGNNPNVWDDGAPLVLENSSQQLLGALPSTRVFVPGRGGSARIDKHIHRTGNQQRILFGCTMADYLNLGPGEVIFDPPIQEQVGADDDDGYENISYGTPGGWNSDYNGTIFVGHYATQNLMSVCMRFLGVTGPEEDATIETDTATFTVERDGGSGTVDITCTFDISAQRQDALSATHNHLDNWTNGTEVDTTIVGASAGGPTKVSGAFDAALEDLFASADGGWASGDDCCGAMLNDETSTDTYLAFDSYEGVPGNACILDFTYNNPAGGDPEPNLLTLLGVG